MKFQQVILGVIVVMADFCSWSNEQACYTPWEQSLFEVINAYRRAAGQPDLVYSDQLTHAAVYELEHPGSYKQARETVGYNGLSALMLYSFDFDFTTPVYSLDALLSVSQHVEFLQGKSYNTYVALGLSRIKNELCVVLGTTMDESGKMIECEAEINNKNYTWIFEPQDDFWEICTYHIGNYIGVRNINKWGVCDLTGRLVLPFSHDHLSPYDNGTFLIGSEIDNQPYQVIDTTGKVIADIGGEGRLYVDGENLWIEYEGNYNYLVNSSGTRLSANYTDMYPIGYGYIAFQKGNLYGVMDYTGKILMQPLYGEIFGYSERKAAVKKGSKWGFIDTTLTLVIQPFVSEKLDFYFECGLVPFKVNGKGGYIDSTGRVAIAPVYEEVGTFGDAGLAPVSINEKYGYINTRGEVVVPLNYVWALPFDCGYGALLDDSGLFAIVDSRGEIITEHEFNQLYFMPDHIVKAKASGRWGMLKINQSYQN